MITVLPVYPLPPLTFDCYLHETWCVYRVTRACLNGVLNKSLPSVSVCIALRRIDISHNERVTSVYVGQRGGIQSCYQLGVPAVTAINNYFLVFNEYTIN